MISVQEAKALIRAHSKALQPATVSLWQAAGLTLAQDVVAPMSLPSFAQSAMDGYAFGFEKYNTANFLLVAGEVEAGSSNLLPLPAGTAVRIFTGAPLPPGADTVVMQEKVNIDQNRMLITDLSINKGSHVKQVGTDIREGELALAKDTLLTPAAIGLLAAMGITEVMVYPKPWSPSLLPGKRL